MEQTPPRTPPRPQPEASRLVEAARAPPKVEISVGETKVRQILKPIESLTVVRNDALGKGYHGKNLTRPTCSEPFDYQGKGYIVTGPVETSLVVDGAEFRTKALVVEDPAFAELIVVGKHDICATGLDSQRDSDGAFGLDEDLTILAPFISTKGHLMQKGLVDTGAGSA